VNSKKDIICDSGSPAERCIRGQHRKCPGERVVPEGTKVIHQNAALRSGGIANDCVWAQERPRAEGRIFSHDSRGMDEREKPATTVLQTLRNGSASFGNAYGENESVVRGRHKLGRIAKNG